MRPIVLALTAGFAVTATAQPPAAGEAEAWVRVTTMKGSRLIRVAGGPVVQVPPPPPGRGPEPVPEFAHLTVKGQLVGALVVAGGKKVLYSVEDPGTVPAGEKAGLLARATPGLKTDRRRNLLVLADRDGANPTTLLTGVQWLYAPSFWGGSTTPHCWAERDGKWVLYRLPMADPTPVRLTKTGVASIPAYHALADGRVLYHEVTAWENEVVPIGVHTTGRGPVVLTDGKTDTVVLKDWVGTLPEISADGTKLAVPKTTAAGEHVAEVIDLPTGAAKQYRVKDFHADWTTCKVGTLRFSPDGRALAVGFRLASQYGREKGPAPGDEAIYHLGVVWLDGRPNPTRAIEVDPVLQDWRRLVGIYTPEWAAAPPATP